jgi:hypothetical protein
MTIDEKCQKCIVNNKAIECPLYNDCLLELKIMMNNGRNQNG